MEAVVAETSWRASFSLNAQHAAPRRLRPGLNCLFCLLPLGGGKRALLHMARSVNFLC